MAATKLTVVISQAPGRNPVKRQLEEELTTELLFDNDVQVSLVPHLYDLDANHTGLLFLRALPGDVVLLSWMYPRAARWILDRQGIKGREGVSLLRSEDEDEDEEHEPPPSNGIGALDVPKRNIYCIDLRLHPNARPYLEEIRRIASEKSTATYDLMQWIGGKPEARQLERYLSPPSPAATPATEATVEAVKPRWYPVIDYARCTNCMECIDFCLFGVYGVDGQERILVEQQDNCKRGCPACSRVCPENAIIFPGHKTPAIAGADGEIAGLKIDLSKLFGAPNALDMAVQERDAELVADGREAVGMSVGIPRRQPAKPAARDELDDLMDGLDQLEA